MRSSVYSADSNPAIDKPAYRRSKSYVEDLVKRGDAVRLDSFSVQLIDHSAAHEEARVEAEYGPLGRGNLLPFAKYQNPVKHPEKLHYPIPACGAHGRFLRVTDVNLPQLNG